MSKAADGDAIPPGTFAPLRNQTFRSIWLATQVSSLGWLMQIVAISWLMATISTSDLMVALVQASSNLPAFILSVFAGVLADNFSRRKVMLAGRCLMVIASAMLTAAVAIGFVDPWMILGFSFLIASGGALNDPAWQASVGDIVDRRDIPAAVTLLSVGFNTVRTVGPALGGLVVASFGLRAAFAVTTLSYLVPLGTIWRCKWKVRSSPLPREAMRTAIYDGLRFTAMSSEIKTAIARGTLFGLASIAILAPGGMGGARSELWRQGAGHGPGAGGGFQYGNGREGRRTARGLGGIGLENQRHHMAIVILRDRPGKNLVRFQHSQHPRSVRGATSTLGFTRTAFARW